MLKTVWNLWKHILWLFLRFYKIFFLKTWHLGESFIKIHVDTTLFLYLSSVDGVVGAASAPRGSHWRPQADPWPLHHGPHHPLHSPGCHGQTGIVMSVYTGCPISSFTLCSCILLIVFMISYWYNKQNTTTQCKATYGHPAFVGSYR